MNDGNFIEYLFFILSCFHNYFIDIPSSNYATKSPPHLKRFATLPCDVYSCQNELFIQSLAI